jgi:hypothetical protein
VTRYDRGSLCARSPVRLCSASGSLQFCPRGLTVCLSLGTSSSQLLKRLPPSYHGHHEELQVTYGSLPPLHRSAGLALRQLLAAAVAELHAVHGPVRGHLLRHCQQQQCYLCANRGVELGDQHGLLISIMMRHGNAWKMGANGASSGTWAT